MLERVDVERNIYLLGERMQGCMYSLGWGVVLLDGRIDEDGQVVGGGVYVLLSLGDPELCHQFIKNLDGVFVLFGGHACGC